LRVFLRKQRPQTKTSNVVSCCACARECLSDDIVIGYAHDCGGHLRNDLQRRLTGMAGRLQPYAG
jgi:hypothetical protein